MTRTLILWLVAFAVIGLLFWYLSSSTQQADTGQSAIPAGSTALVAVSVPTEFSAEGMAGKIAFDAKCAVCHGESAQGTKGKAPSLIQTIYRPAHHADFAFVLAVQNGVRAHHWPFGNMPPIEGLEQTEVLNIATYVREIQRENGIE